MVNSATFLNQLNAILGDPPCTCHGFLWNFWDSSINLLKNCLESQSNIGWTTIKKIGASYSSYMSCVQTHSHPGCGNSNRHDWVLPASCHTFDQSHPPTAPWRPGQFSENDWVKLRKWDDFLGGYRKKQLPYAPCMEYLPTFTSKISQTNVGKYM